MTEAKIGALCWNQYTDWPSLLDAGVRADRQLDHMSGGRMICGIGAAWFEDEHADFGLELGASPGERLRWLEEAVVILRGMFDETEPSGSYHYSTHRVRNDPPPVQAHLPIVVGVGGERRTLRIVARHADACNLGGGFERVRAKEAILLRHCAEVGRDPTDIERTANLGVVVIRDTEAEARQRLAELAAHNGGSSRDRVPAPHRRLPGAVRRRDHGTPRHRGQTDDRGRLA